MNLHLWGTDFRRSDSGFRQKLYLPLETREQSVRSLLDFGFKDLVYIHTCNRVEFYTTSQSYYADTRELWRKMFEKFGLDPDLFYRGYFFEGKSVLRHLLRAASSLESLVIGETQVLGQFREAFRWTKESKLPMELALEQAFQLAFETARKIRATTSIGEKTISIASLGIERLASMEAGFPLRQVVAVGRGPMAVLFVEWLRKNHPDCPVLWLNRRVELIQKLSEEFGVESMSLSQFLDSPRSFSHLITATSSEQPLFTREFFERLEWEPRLVFDFAEPPDVSLPGSCTHLASVVRIDDLSEQARENRGFRMQAVRSAEEIINGAMREYFLKLKQAPVLRNFNSVEETFKSEFELAMQEIEEEFPIEHHKKIRKWAEKLLKKNLHSSKIHLRSILSNISGEVSPVP